MWLCPGVWVTNETVLQGTHGLITLIVKMGLKHINVMKLKLIHEGYANIWILDYISLWAAVSI